MSEAQVDIETILWMQNEKSDKIWGFVTVEDKMYSFWGRRNKKLQFKFEGHRTLAVYREVEEKSYQKRRKGYEEITWDEVCERVMPGFKAKLKQELMTAILTQKVH